MVFLCFVIGFDPLDLCIGMLVFHFLLCVCLGDLIFGSDPFKKFEHDPPNADAPFVPAPRGKQGGPELVVEPAAGKIKKRVHFPPTISTVHRIYQSHHEV